MTTINISNPVNKNINMIAGTAFGNFLSFQIKIKLPTTPLITVEMAEARAVVPPKLNLYAPDIIPTGIPTKGPPNKPLIITINDLMFAGVPLIITQAYESKSPIILNIIKHIN